MLGGRVRLCLFFYLTIRRPPRSTRTDTLFPSTALFRSILASYETVAGIEDLGFDDDGMLWASSEAGSKRWSHRSEEHTPEPQSLMRIAYDVGCVKHNDPAEVSHAPEQTVVVIQIGNTKLQTHIHNTQPIHHNLT